MKIIVPELIRKKRDGAAMTGDELAALVAGFADGSIPDYQISAWLMAVFFKGLSPDEIVQFTRCMKDSGETLNWRSLHPSFNEAAFVDKHSTGGVGDKVSLILAPLASALGCKVPMMSGRGLGFTGGTVDKLQSIAGFNMYLSESKRTQALLESGFCMMAQSEKLCPADRKLYALRDVTATVESLPLITGSIVSKKWAAGVENIVYDVKCGSAAFMPDLASARALAESLVRVSKLAGMRAKALITAMSEPLGAKIGNALEVKECIAILQNNFVDAGDRSRAEPLIDLSLRLAAEMVVLAGVENDLSLATQKCRQALTSGRAFELFEKNLAIQGAVADWQKQLAVAPYQIEFRADRSGSIKSIDSRPLGLAGIVIGAGRARNDDQVDPAVGFDMRVSVGERVEVGTMLLCAHLRKPEQMAEIHDLLAAAFQFGDAPNGGIAGAVLGEVI